MQLDKEYAIIRLQRSRGIFSRMFVGLQHHQKDEHNRIRIPQVFRSQLGPTFYFAEGVDGKLYIHTAEYVEELIEDFDKSADEFNPEQINAMVEYFQGFRMVTEDKQGRVTIPDDLVKFANLGRDIVSVGVGKFIVMMSSDLHKSSTGVSRSEKMKILSQMRKKKD